MLLTAHRSTYVRRFLIALWLLIALMFLGRMTTAQSTMPIKKDSLIAAIKTNGLPTADLVKRIQRRGVAFQVTPEIEREMGDVGAAPETVEACKKNYRRFKTQPAELAAVAPSESSPAVSGAPLASSEIVMLLGAGVPSGRVEKMVNDRGVSFSLGPQSARYIRSAGGAPTLSDQGGEYGAYTGRETQDIRRGKRESKRSACRCMRRKKPGSRAYRRWRRPGPGQGYAGVQAHQLAPGDPGRCPPS